MKLEESKKIYDSTEIPAELTEVVNRAIASKNKEEIYMNYEKRKKRTDAVKIFRYVAAAAAGLLICFAVGVNTSEAFAKEMSEVPVLGALAKVLTVRSYHGTEGDYEIDVEVPEIIQESEASGQMGEVTETQEFTDDINAEIQKIVDDYMEQAKTEFEEYKKAFFETGGTQEEWDGRTMDISVDYDVKYQDENILSLELATAKSWVSAQEERYYYNLDLSTGKYLTLRDVLGEDYVKICNESIVAQIEERIAEDENKIYFGFGPNAEADKEMGITGFETVTENTGFYLNSEKNPVIVFPKYEIAPGYMGFQEFEIIK